MYHGGPNILLETQRLEAGRWVSNPVPAMTDNSGRFTTYVELAAGDYWLRMLDPDSGVTSEIFTVTVKA